MSLTHQLGALESAAVPIGTTAPRGPVVSVKVDVTPQKKDGEDGDIILLGHVGKSEVEVVFKKNEAIRPLLARLTQLLRAARAKSVATGTPHPNVSDLRIPLNVQGTWRVRLQFDEDDMPVRYYQLLAARWNMRASKDIPTEALRPTGT